MDVNDSWQDTSLAEKMRNIYQQYTYFSYSCGRNHDHGFIVYLDDFIMEVRSALMLLACITLRS